MRCLCRQDGIAQEGKKSAAHTAALQGKLLSRAVVSVGAVF